MKKISKIIGITSIVVAATAITACYQLSPENKADYMADRISKTLGLNQSQSMQLNDLKRAVLTVHSDMRDQHNTIHQEFLTLLSQPTIEDQTVLDLLDSHIQQMRSYAPLIVQPATQFYNQLTPEQKAEIHQAVNTQKAIHQLTH